MQIHDRLVTQQSSIVYGVFIVIALAFGLQIVMLLPLSVGISTTPFSIAFRAIVLFASLLLIAIGLHQLKKLSIHIGILSLLTFYLIYVFRLFYDLTIIGVPLSYRLHSASHIYLFSIGSTLIPLIGLALCPKTADGKIVEKTIFLASFLQCIAIAIIFFYFYGLTPEAFLSRHIVSGAFEESNIGKPINPITVSRAGGYLALFSIAYKKRAINIGIARIAGIVLGLALLFLGASRGPLIGFVVCILFLGLNYLFNPKKSFVWVLKIIISIVIIIIIFQYISSNFDKFDVSVFERFSKMFESGNSFKSDERLHTWKAAWGQFLSSPVYGDKFVEDYTNTYPHNLFLEVLMSVGLLGAIPFTLAVFYAFKRAVHLFRMNMRIIFLFFLYGIVCIMFSGSIFLSPEFWVTFALIFIVQVDS